MDEMKIYKEVKIKGIKKHIKKAKKVEKLLKKANSLAKELATVKFKIETIEN